MSTSGSQRIRGAFTAAAADGRAALIAYVVAGHPDRATAALRIDEISRAGADIIELGLPFSDPLADGAVIRDATRRALDGGMSIAGCLDLAAEIRASGNAIPLIGMGYVNPLLAYGLERFCADAAAAGIDGLIVPDVPLESADELRRSAAATGLGITMLVTPLTEDARIEQLAHASTGFCYAVSSTGTTGARAQVDASTIELLKRIHALAGTTPVAVGFGVASAAHVATLAPHADGVIVGSALVARLEAAPNDVAAWIGELHHATRRDR